MERLNGARMRWAVERAWNLHGPTPFVTLALAAIVLLLCGWAVVSSMRIGDLEQALEQSRRATRPVRTLRAPSQDAALPLPDASRRFELTARILSTLRARGLEPKQIRFKFDDAADAGLQRQIAVFTLEAPWRDVADALVQLQATDRAVYLARLRVTRHDVSDPNVSAEVQLGIALVGDATPREADR